MRGLSAPREQKGSPNSCRAPPVGTASLTRSTQTRHCGTQRPTCGTLELDFSPGFAGRPRSAKLRKSHCLQPTEQLKKLKPRLW